MTARRVPVRVGRPVPVLAPLASSLVARPAPRPAPARVARAER